MKFIVSEIARNLNQKILPFKMGTGFLYKIFSLNNSFFKVGKIREVENIVTKWIAEDTFSGELLYKKYNFRAETSISEAIQRQTKSYIESLGQEK